MSMSREARRLREFMQERYPHRVGENDAWTDAAIVDAAIAIMTPGDGSEAAWARMRAACGLEGPEAQRALLRGIVADDADANASGTAHEVVTRREGAAASSSRA